MENAPPTTSSAEASEALIRQLREELIKTQMIVLELNDRILEKETDRLDAIAILGRVELVLEQKIDYIVQLDQALNARIGELTKELEQARGLVAQQAAEITRICAERDREYAARDAIIQDHVTRLDLANQEIGRAHNLAGGFARDLAHTRDALSGEQSAQQRTNAELAAVRAQLESTAQTLAQNQGDLAATTSALLETRTQLSETARELAVVSEKLRVTDEQLAAERRTVATVKASLLWRLGRPWRAVFGPKL